MGQYYQVVCLDTKQRINPDGSKLMEHAYTRNVTTLIATNLLKEGGDWCGKRIVWAGDYGKGVFESEFPTWLRFPNGPDKYERCLYEIARETFEDLGVEYSYQTNTIDEINQMIRERKEQEEKSCADIQYFINLDKKEYFDIKKARCGFHKDYIIHPLPILCAYGNGEGGGDYFGPNGGEEHPSLAYCGTWAGHHIKALTTNQISELEGYTEIIPGFTESCEE